MFKKITAILFSLAIFFSVFTVSASAAEFYSNKDNYSTPTSGVQSADPHHASGLYNTATQGRYSKNAAGLIAFSSLDMYLESGNTLLLDGTTDGSEVLDKIGFQNITLQRWQNGNWNNVKVWSTYRYNSSTYNYEYKTTVTPGYDYRFVATHYGEIDWLSIPSIETFYNETSYLHVG
ncbi:MAG TPA: hypothetical protein GXX74_08165 [Clostridiales bacterium]|jgi:hypothetical protein|nr:hypothetical protein [Clostridiales bacterium]